MTLLCFACNNVRENRRTYFGFLASSVFAVVVFYLFAAFRALPAVAEGRYYGAQGVAIAFRVCQYLIIVFSIFFTLYSNSAFVKSRKRELGILALLGARQRQLSLLLFGESMLVGIVAIATGLAIGGLLGRLFVMIIDRILMLPQPIPFVMQSEPVLTTAFVYLVISTAISAINSVSVNVSQIVQLVKAPSKPKTPPTYSRPKIVLGIVCLVIGYFVASIVTMGEVLLAFLPVTAVVCVGTHILFTQGSVAVLHRLERMEGLYYKGINLLTISDLVFKMKDNARILAQVAILGAVVLTASGVIYTLGAAPGENAKYYDRAISLVLPGTEDSVRIANDFQECLVEGGAAITDAAMMPAIQVSMPELSQGATVLIVSADSYNEWAREAGVSEAHPGYGHVVRVVPTSRSKARPDEIGQTISVRAGNRDLAFVSDERIAVPLGAGMGDIAFALIAEKGHFDELARDLSEEHRRMWFSYEIPNWIKTAKAELAAREAILADYPVAYHSRMQEYSRVTVQVRMIMFISMFVATLFFLAAGSILYFRFFLEIQEDQARYIALRRIGFSWKEVRGIVTREMAIMFFTPWAVAFVHQMFALRSYSTVTSMMPVEVWRYGVMTAGIFFALQTVYFLLARSAYLEELAPDE